MKIIAHRGANRERPENTLSAFTRALEIGVDAIEFDLLLTKDRKIVARHDDLIRHEGKWHYVRELTYEELKKMDLGGGECVPLIEQVFELLHRRVPIFLDLKSFGLSPFLAKFLKSRGAGEEVHVTSFLHSEIAEMGHKYPSVGRSIIMAAMPVRFSEMMEYAGTREVSLFRGYLNETIARALRKEEIVVRAYPVNLPQEAALFSKWGVEAIFTDDPAAVKV